MNNLDSTAALLLSAALFVFFIIYVFFSRCKRREKIIKNTKWDATGNPFDIDYAVVLNVDEGFVLFETHYKSIVFQQTTSIDNFISWYPIQIL
jgi:hypothetical protein